MSLRPLLRKCVAGSTPGRAAEIRCATLNAAPRTRARSTIAGGTRARNQGRRFVCSLKPAVTVRTPPVPRNALPDADRAENCVGDQAQGLFAAVVRMNPPADVGQQARGMAQAGDPPPVSRSLATLTRRSVQQSVPRHGAQNATASFISCAAQINPSFARSVSGNIEYNRPSRTP